MKPRWYQEEAVNEFFSEARKHPKDDIAIALPTGAGKTIVMANIIGQVLEWGFRVLVLARTKELLVQNEEKFLACYPQHEANVGTYCAGLGSREYKQPVIFGSVQSCYQKAMLLGPRKLVIVDECHQIPPEGTGQYRQLLTDLKEIEPTTKLLGLTASPYRLDGGVIVGGGQPFDRIAYTAPLGRLIDDGYLTPPKTRKVTKVDLSGVRITAGDFNKGDVESRFLANSITREVLAEANAAGAKSILVFASGVAHAQVIKGELEALGEEVRLVTGETPALFRDTSIASFVSQRVRWMINVECLTTGFDAPAIDMIVVARATESPGLFLQMVGRGFRLYPGKEQCWILDYGGNIERHGPIDSPTYGIDTIKPASSGDGECPTRICPQCFEENHAAAARCIRCGLEFPRKPKVFVSSKADIVSKPVTLDVLDIKHERWRGKDSKPDTLRITYLCADDDRPTGKRWVSEWICIEHEGYAQRKAKEWWQQVSRNAFPETIDEALEIIDLGGVAATKSITVKKEGKYDRVVSRKVSDAPEPVEIGWGYDEEIPF